MVASPALDKSPSIMFSKTPGNRATHVPAHFTDAADPVSDLAGV
jgi:hypothetical protein